MQILYFISALDPVSCEFDQTKECFAVADILDPVHIDIADADLVSLLQVEEAGCVTHHLHLHSSMFLTLDSNVVIDQNRETLILVLVHVGHLSINKVKSWRRYTHSSIIGHREPNISTHPHGPSGQPPITSSSSLQLYRCTALGWLVGGPQRFQLWLLVSSCGGGGGGGWRCRLILTSVGQSARNLHKMALIVISTSL